MRSAGAFLFGAILSGVVAGWLGMGFLDRYADSLRGNPSPGAGFGAVFVLLVVVGVAALVATGVGYASARWFAHPIISIAGAVLALALLTVVTVRVLDFRRDSQVAERRNAEWVVENDRKEAPRRNAEAKERVRHDAESRETGTALLGAWMPEGGKIDDGLMRVRRTAPDWPEIFAYTEREKPDAVMARIASDGWTFEQNGSTQKKWSHGGLIRPGDGVPVEVTVIQQGSTIILQVIRPHTDGT